ncbi:MAG: hypothetical protein QXE70_11090 [Ignisphaera sp.]
MTRFNISSVLQEQNPELLEQLSELGERVYYEGNFYALLTILEKKMEYAEKIGLTDVAKDIEKQILFYEEIFSQKVTQIYKELYNRDVVAYYDFKVDRFRDALSGEFLKPPHKLSIEEVAPYFLRKEWKFNLSDLGIEF